MNSIVARFGFMKKWWAKWLFVFLAIAIAALLVLFLVNLSKATAITMRLVQTEGEVNLSNDENQELDIEHGMRLFSGDSLETDVDSYAYISLDDVKSVQLDALSSCTLKEDGEHLQVDLTEGNLFFEVSSPLEAEEEFNIRTSNAVTSIRGTSGYVVNESTTLSHITILTGEVLIQYMNPKTNEEDEIAITAGETITVNTAEGSDDSYELNETNPNDIPYFVISGLQNNNTLLAEIKEQSGMDLTSTATNATEYLQNQAQHQNSSQDDDDDDDSDEDNNDDDLNNQTVDNDQDNNNNNNGHSNNNDNDNDRENHQQSDDDDDINDGDHTHEQPQNAGTATPQENDPPDDTAAIPEQVNAPATEQAPVVAPPSDDDNDDDNDNDGDDDGDDGDGDGDD